ncbi:hypothetical protein L533_0928, partial [Bordetella bronchiseptica OSU553]
KDLLLPRGSSRYEELRRAGELRPVHLAGESDDGASRAAGTGPKKRARRGRAA